MGPLYLKAVLGDGLVAARNSSLLVPGCSLLAVDGTHVGDASHGGALQALRAATQRRRTRARPLVLRFQPPAPALDETEVASTPRRLARVAREAAEMQRRRDEWVEEALRGQLEEEDEHRRLSVHGHGATATSSPAEQVRT